MSNKLVFVLATITMFGSAAAMNPPMQAVAPQQTGMYQAQPQQMLPHQPTP